MTNAEPLNGKWVEEFRPSSFDDFIFQDEVTKMHIMKYVEQKTLPHLMLSGPPGTGKTSCALLLMKEIGIEPMDTCIINASSDNNIATIRDRVTNFCSTAPLMSPFKVVLLEEGDFLSDEAQGAMRRLTEERHQTVKFIITCNNPSKVVAAIDSRFAHFIFKTLPQEDVVMKVVNVLDAKNIQWEIEDVNAIIQSSPTDLRKIIQKLDQYSTNGKLVLPLVIATDNDIIEKISSCVAQGTWDQLRSFVGTNLPESQIPNIYRNVYDALERNTKFKEKRELWEQAVVTVAEYMTRSASVADQFINFAALTVELKRI